MTNPFKWRESREPSIFAQDPYFRAPSSGKTNSEAQTEQVQRRREQGELPGHIHNLGKPSKKREEQLLAYKQFGIYSKAKPSIRVRNRHEEPNATPRPTKPAQAKRSQDVR